MAKPLRVLVVDDEQDICDIFESVLKQQGYDVTCALDGATGGVLLEDVQADGVHFVIIKDTAGRIRAELYAGHPPKLQD